MPGLIFQLPSDAENSCWHSKGELVDQPRHGYTVQEYGRLFADMQYQQGLAIWNATRNLFADLTAPGVEIHCLYGTGVDTPAKLIYKGNKFPDGYPKDEEEDGDGVVSSCSLEASRAWSTRRNSGKAVVHVPLKKVDHLEILEDKAVLDYIERVAITVEA
nr:hypothetical protein BaRGS_022455 [Batillaria attramentaria]